MNMKTVMMMAAAVLFVGVAGAAEKQKLPLGTEAGLKPLAWHIASPREMIDLCGEWDYASVKCTQEKYPDPADATKTKTRFVRTEVKDFNALNWAKVVLPWGMQGLSANEYIYFRRTFELPAGVASKRVIFKAERIVDTYSLIVNGTRLPAATPFEVPWENDLTGLVKPGTNEIIIEVSNDFERRAWKDSPFQHSWAYKGSWGVARPCHLEIMNPVAIDHVVVRTKVTPEKVLTLLATVTNTTDKAVEVEVGATIEEALGGDASSVGKKECQILSPDAGMRRPPVVVPPHGSATIEWTTKWPDAKLWDLEHPNLYFADVKIYESGRLGEATLPKGTANGRVGSPSRPSALGGDASSVGKKEGQNPSPDAGMRWPPIDAYRARFGFREISIKAHQFLVNGKPYIHRRTTHVFGGDGDGYHPSEEEIKTALFTLRKAGTVGMRIFGSDWARWADVADRYGAFLTPVTPGGNGAGGKSELFWKVYADYQAKIARYFINSPSVFAWALGNEFGTIYGCEGRSYEKKTTDHQALLGRKMEAIDPTRPWTYCGEVCIGYPVRGGIGPAPIRSFHYPIATCRDGITMPESGYWYDKGELSWQRISTKDKPLVISEDIYHGTMDMHRGMAKAGGDSIYTLDGYAKTLHYIIRSLCEGYYYSGLGGWETWITWQSRGDKNLLNRLGALMPHYLIATRENFPNLRGGEKAERNVYCYNQLFTPYDCELVREDWFDGKMVFTETRKFLLDQGMKHHEKIIIDAPKVKKPGTYEVRFKLLGGDASLRRETKDGKNSADADARSVAPQLLTERTYTYTVFPKKTEVDVKGETALLASAESVLRKMDFARGVYASVEEVLASGAKAIVVDKSLTEDEGRKLNDFALAGGKVLFIEADEASWTPLMIEFRRPFSFVWRRNDDEMKGMDETWMKAWMPDHTLGDSSYPKPQADARILWDNGQRVGLTNANIFWLNRGKGAWMLCQLPVLSRFALEPAAPHVLQATLDEFANGTPELTGRVVTAPGSKAAEALAALKIETSGRLPTREDVLVLDASEGLGEEQLLAARAHTKNRGTVLILAPKPGANDEFFAELGMKLTPMPRATTFIWGANREIDIGPKWLVRKNSSGLMAGLATDDMFWGKEDPMNIFMMKWMCDDTNRWFSVRKPNDRPIEHILSGIIEPLPGAKIELCTEPAGIASCAYEKGKVVVTTLRFGAFAASYSQQVARTLRTLLTNLGAETMTPERVHSYAFIDLRGVFNRGLWNDPVYQKADGSFDPVGWFGNENDMRYFPVNLCGWSLIARNFCPKEEFPTEPMNLGGTKFRLTDPVKNKGRGCLVLGPGESARIPLPKGLTAQKFWFLGAAQHGRRGGALEMKLSSSKETTRFSSGEHYATYRVGVTLPKGAVAWYGATLKDDQASLYNWCGANPAPEKPVAWMELKNTATNDSVAIVAITAELTDK